MTIGAVPRVVRELEQRGRLTTREVRSAEIFAERLHVWDQHAKDDYHRVMSSMGKHYLVLEMLFVGHMSLREMARFILNTTDEETETRTVEALVALDALIRSQGRL